MDYICIKSPNYRGTIELPLEDDGSLLLTTLTSQFPDATGLTFYCESAQATRGLKLSEGKLWPPRGGWSNTSYSCTTNKGVSMDLPVKLKYETPNQDGIHSEQVSVPEEEITPKLATEGMFIRVAEPIPLNDGCYLGCCLDGLTDDQMYRLSGILYRKLRENAIIQNSDSYYKSNMDALYYTCFKSNLLSFGQHVVLNVRAMELMSFLKKEYKAKIINFDSLYGTIHLPPEVPGDKRSPIGTAIWTLELDEI
ncbi:hypothetical protein QYM36_019342 [Artemia franciscana]|uniref:TAR DNA-binding protein 43 N-terminal domain-containing protein n=2 Tax=Artemia franciscana TaxID=6661 RepID=A0AA88KTV8_ARTSF|nr:hypothetical protein QYM36_019342 [Artemia franciscana]